MHHRLIRFILYIVLLFSSATSANPPVMPEGFVYLDEAIPGIRLEMNYYSGRNFIGKPVDGYLQPRAILSRPAADALAAVQRELSVFGLGLKIFDAYRPQRAVNHFVRWAGGPDDLLMKSRYYPAVDKSKLFAEGYIAERSGHSRGSTVDLTVVSLAGGENIDMGGVFDFFGPESRPAAHTSTSAQRAHRMLLQLIMEKHGFVPYPQEWWHFTLQNEPYPDTYFDFPVQ